MRLSLRIFIAYFFLVGLGMMLFLYSTFDQLHPVLRQTSEEALVDTANLLAEFAPEALVADDPTDSRFARAAQRYHQREIDARIWSRDKTIPAFEIYLTDERGRVIFHTMESEIGADYSRWIDVSRTLRGQYGARTTQKDPEDESTSAMYVAAPVHVEGRLAGVVTVSQPNRSIQPFLDYAQRQILQLGSGILLLALLLGGFFSYWLTRSVRRLVDYVETVRRGEKARLPDIREASLARLAHSTESMRREIDGKRYVEEYVHNLTHEMKSPLSAVRGAVEILQEDDVSAAGRHRFLRNIDTESRRMQRLVERLLSLASLENRQGLVNLEPINVGQLVSGELDRHEETATSRGVRMELNEDDRDMTVDGERFLLEQAVRNLLDNALEFCPDGGSVSVTVHSADDKVSIAIRNDGDSVPDYALPRLFERFYSLERPGAGGKSTGLGLSFVREIAGLHGGDVWVENDAASGVVATLTLSRHAEPGIDAPLRA